MKASANKWWQVGYSLVFIQFTTKNQTLRPCISKKVTSINLGCMQHIVYPDFWWGQYFEDDIIEPSQISCEKAGASIILRNTSIKFRYCEKAAKSIAPFLKYFPMSKQSKRIFQIIVTFSEYFNFRNNFTKWWKRPAICTKEGFYTFNTDWSTEVHELCRVTSATSPPSLTMKTLIFWLKIKSCLHLYSISRKNLNPLWKRPFIPLTPIDRQRCMSCVGSRQQHPRPRWQWRL